jgi:hypothetical protein
MGRDEIGGRNTSTTRPGRDVWVGADKTNRTNADKIPKIKASFQKATARSVKE